VATLAAIGALSKRLGMKKTGAAKASGTDRRSLLKNLALGTTSAVGLGSAVLTAPSAMQAASAHTPASATQAATAELAQADVAAAANANASSSGPPITVSDAGSDFMLDVIKTLDLDYVALNPGGSIRGLHESIIHYGANTKPSLISVNHEEIGVAIAHGYARAAGKPMAALIYGVLGLQHAAMAMYNAYADRVPIMLFAGNVGNENKRFAPPSWYHSAADLADLVQGSIKWSDQPISPHYIADSFHRAYRLAVTPPQGPSLVILDDWLQERSLSDIRSKLTIPTYHAPAVAIAEPQALADAARMLASAQYPVIVVDRAVSAQAGMDRIAELAELVGAAVLNGPSRICMATDHPLNLTGMQTNVVPKADVILFLGVDDMWDVLFSLSDTVTRSTRRVAKPDVKTISVSIDDYAARGNIQDQLHALDVDLPIIGDPEASVPHLIAALKRQLGGGSHDPIAQRSAAIKNDHDKLRNRYLHDATFGWDATPVSVARLTAELNAALAGESWSVITNSDNFLNGWPQKLWNITRWNEFQMNSGAGGLGFSLPSAIGAALALSNTGIIPVAFQTDGDLMYVNSALWTAAHHHIPLLIVMHNNRSYHAEHMNIQLMANRRQRGVTDTGLGTTLVDPPIDFAMLARSMGVWGTGPVTDPQAVGPALTQALAVVKGGQPALVDVVTQPR
jgi:thiamine pyrophosphate-dependent acetolactate synthase large subunit-like protein